MRIKSIVFSFTLITILFLFNTDVFAAQYKILGYWMGPLSMDLPEGSAKLYFKVNHFGSGYKKISCPACQEKGLDIIADGYIPQGQAYVMIKDNTTSEINSIESGEIILDPSHSYSVTISLERGKGSIQCFGDGTHSPCGYTEDHYSEISGTIFVYGLAGPTISQGPKDLEVYSHEQAEFTIQGENISSYCWQVSTSEGYTDLCDSIDSEGVSYSGVKSSTLHISNVSIDQNGKKYRCVLTDSEGTSLESEAATLTVLQNTSISVIIPKKIVLSGSEKEGEYLVRVSGFLPKDRSLTVAPNTASFILTQDGKEPIVPLLYQDITAFSPSEEGLLDREARGKISAKELSAGIWNGSFYFDISLS